MRYSGGWGAGTTGGTTAPASVEPFTRKSLFRQGATGEVELRNQVRTRSLSGSADLTARGRGSTGHGRGT